MSAANKKKYPTHGVIYFFNNDQYWRWNPALSTANAVGSWYPSKINDGSANANWPEMPINIDASVVWKERKALYIFKGEQYWRWDTEKGEMLSGYPKNISANWPGLPSTVDAAVAFDELDALYFFKDDKYWKWSKNSNTIYNNYPLDTAKLWGFPGSSTPAALPLIPVVKDVLPCCRWRGENRPTWFDTYSKDDNFSLPPPQIMDPSTEEYALYSKLVKILVALYGYTSTDDEDDVIRIISQEMNDAEKCYLCARVAAFKEGTSILGYIQDDITYGLDDEEFARRVDKALNCGNYGRKTWYQAPGEDVSDLHSPEAAPIAKGPSRWNRKCPE